MILDSAALGFIFGTPPVDPATFVPPLFTLASDVAAGDYFGYAVAISGDTVVVSAKQDDDKGGNSGSAYVFVKPSAGWSGTVKETAKFLAADGAIVKGRFC